MTGLIILGIMLLFVSFPWLIDLYFYIGSKFDNRKIEKDYKPSRTWLSKNIINEIWTEENIPLNFTKEGIDKYNEDMSKLTDIKKESEVVIKECKDENVDDFYGVNKTLIKMEESMINIQINLAKLGFRYSILEHFNVELLTEEFIKKIDDAINEDLSWTETADVKLMTGYDKIGLCFVETILKMVKNEDLNTKYKERYDKVHVLVYGEKTKAE